MTALNKQALLVPERKRHDWSLSVMRDCDFCSQWSLTVKHENGGCICASCCDAEYTEELKSALESAIDRAESAEKRIAELEARTVVVKQFDDFQIVHYGGSEDYAKGYIDCQNNYNKALVAAGIGVKGE
ncbi:hypothetical protein I5520_01845 [Citrobacter sp. FDAARGOS_156]|uniref:hypothetical protein n=1 Tax=Citrobacter sp. FDAARGOS_156 TaxID=1702170 RepID=UPI001904C997|nr:hypothetical protein [Citrobacter sp. FDAARGOS_156]MBJ9640740.1 hypothetical protein [Citrobacter sp. FDAARGOS_156]